MSAFFIACCSANARREPSHGRTSATTATVVPTAQATEVRDSSAIRTAVDKGQHVAESSRPYESIAPDVVQQIRETSGREPATRTMVRSSVAGHSVQIFLLRDCGRLNA